MINLLLTFMLFSFLVGCNSIKDGLTLKKKTGADEFLVEKKNPFELPPEFNELPKPESDKIVTNSEDDVIKKLITKDENVIYKREKDIEEKLEESLLKKIKKN